MINNVFLVLILITTSYGSLPSRNLLLRSDTRIVGGQDAPQGLAPYQVSLRFFGSHSCGGSILNKRWILTAAHCTSYVSWMTVVVGTNSLDSGGDSYSIEKAVVHEEYDDYNIRNDIALIKVSRDIQYSDKVKSIALPSNNTLPGTDVVLTGWGTTTYPGDLPVKLQYINLTAISVSECQKRHQNINPVYDTQICTLTTVGEGACHGDSGGPLIEGDSVVGVVSWGMPCAKGYPDVYTRVFSYRKWIVKHIANDDN